MAEPSHANSDIQEGEYENWREILAMLDGDWAAQNANAFDKELLTPALTPPGGSFDLSSPDFSPTQHSASEDQSPTFHDVEQDLWSPAVAGNNLNAEDWAGIFNWDELCGGAPTMMEGSPKPPQLSTLSMQGARHGLAEIAMGVSPHSGIAIPWDTEPSGMGTTVEPFINQQDTLNFGESIALVSPQQIANDGRFFTNPANLQRHLPPTPITPSFHTPVQQTFRRQTSPPSPAISPRTTRHSDDTSSQSPEPVPPKRRTATTTPTNTRKRKAPSSGSTTSPSPAAKQRKGGAPKASHNLIERRYRTNINNRITELRDSVPSLRALTRPPRQKKAHTGDQGDGDGDGDGDDDGDEETGQHQVKKATILAKATEYIRQLEKRNRKMERECEGLRTRVGAFEKLARAGALAGGPWVGDTGTRESTFADGGFEGEQFGAVVSVEGQEQREQARQEAVTVAGDAGRPETHQGTGNRMNRLALGRLMVGSMAGLMVLEGLTEQEQNGQTPTGRGLFSLPLDIFKQHLRHPLSRGVWWGDHPGNASPLSPLLWVKVALLFAAVVYIVSPSFFDPPTREDKQQATLHRLPSPPPTESRATTSPREVRTRAWLTAMQTLHFPRLSFAQDPLAFCLAALRYGIRYLVPAPVYLFSTQQTVDQERARTAAWHLALDAQLGGGDADISTSRLALTFLASLSLPETPEGLMIRALHIRLLFLDRPFLLSYLARRLATRYWNEARSLRRMLREGPPSVVVGDKAPRNPDALPAHLAALLEMDSDDVLLDAILHRAENLAHGRATSAGIADADEGTDAVIDDSSIRTSLDLLAAWHSSHTLHHALLHSLSPTTTSHPPVLLRAALSTAPPRSASHLRALAAHAILYPPHARKPAIAAALAVLPHCELYRVQQAARSIAAVSDAALVTTAGIRVALYAAAAMFWAQDRRPGSGEVAVRGFCALARALEVLPTDSGSGGAGPRVGLLGFVGAWKAVGVFGGDGGLKRDVGGRVESVALGLRVWVGGERGGRCGLERGERERIVEACLEVAKGVDAA